MARNGRTYIRTAEKRKGPFYEEGIFETGATAGIEADLKEAGRCVGKSCYAEVMETDCDGDFYTAAEYRLIVRKSGDVAAIRL